LKGPSCRERRLISHAPHAVFRLVKSIDRLSFPETREPCDAFLTLPARLEPDGRLPECCGKTGRRCINGLAARGPRNVPGPHYADLEPNCTRELYHYAAARPRAGMASPVNPRGGAGTDRGGDRRKCEHPRSRSLLAGLGSATGCLKCKRRRQGAPALASPTALRPNDRHIWLDQVRKELRYLEERCRGGTLSQRTSRPTRRDMTSRIAVF
jgi:hypothetical protein